MKNIFYLLLIFSYSLFGQYSPNNTQYEWLKPQKFNKSIIVADTITHRYDLYLSQNYYPSNPSIGLQFNYNGQLIKYTGFSWVPLIGYTAENIANKGASNGYVPLVSGKIPNQYIGVINLSVGNVSVQHFSQMLALDTAKVNTICMVADSAKSYVLHSSPPSIASNWYWIVAPTNYIYSINGKLGPIISLSASDVGAISSEVDPNWHSDSINYYKKLMINSLFSYKENLSNKSNNVIADSSSTSKYPSVNEMVRYANTKYKGLPLQTGYNGYFLSTNGTNEYWNSILHGYGIKLTGTTPVYINVDTPVLRNQIKRDTSLYSLNSAKIQGVVDSIWIKSHGGSLPPQTGNAGKYLTTNGTNESWGSVASIIYGKEGIYKDGDTMKLGGTVRHGFSIYSNNTMPYDSGVSGISFDNSGTDLSTLSYDGSSADFYILGGAVNRAKVEFYFRGYKENINTDFYIDEDTSGITLYNGSAHYGGIQVAKFDSSGYIFANKYYKSQSVISDSQLVSKYYVDHKSASLPDQTGHSGQYLGTNGTTASWSSVAGGTDTSLLKHKNDSIALSGFSTNAKLKNDTIILNKEINGRVLKTDSLKKYATPKELKDSLNLIRSSIAGKQAIITNLGDTLKYAKMADTLGVHPKLASGQDLRDTAKNIRTTLNTKISTETDPVVKAINGIIKSNGTTISAARAGTDFVTPSQINDTATVAKWDTTNVTTFDTMKVVTLDTTNILTFDTLKVVPLDTIQISTTGTGAFVLANTPTLITPVIGVATGTSLTTTGAITSSGTAGVGYSTGAGGTITQSTSKATAFTLSKICGTIVTASDALASQTTVSCTWTNTTIAATDQVVITHDSGGTLGGYNFAITPGAGSATLYIRNVTGGSLSEAITLRFHVFKNVIN